MQKKRKKKCIFLQLFVHFEKKTTILCGVLLARFRTEKKKGDSNTEIKTPQALTS